MPTYLPALAIGLIVGFYWLRVVKMVIKQKRRTGRDANFVPRESLGYYLRFVWYPVVILWVALPWVLAWYDDLPQPMRRMAIPVWLSWIGVVLAAACLGLTMYCWRQMGRSWRMGIDPDEKTQLIVTGPFAHVRHPIYALSCAMMLASVLAVPVLAMCGIAVLHNGFLQWEARREERYLLSAHGAAYANYMKQSGRFLPRVL